MKKAILALGLMVGLVGVAHAHSDHYSTDHNDGDDHLHHLNYDGGNYTPYYHTHGGYHHFHNLGDRYSHSHDDLQVQPAYTPVVYQEPVTFSYPVLGQRYPGRPYTGYGYRKPTCSQSCYR